jgi:predicted transcriptional regulator
MPAVSQQQQKLFGLALAVKRGEVPRSNASEEVLDIVDTMSEKKIKDFAGTPHMGLPKKVESAIREIVRKELIEAMVGGEWVVYTSTPKGNKLVKTFKSGNEAKSWFKKNSNKLLNTPGVDSAGTMAKSEWDEFEAKWAIESIKWNKKNKSLIKEANEPEIITQLRDVMKSGYKTLKDPKSGKRMKVDSFSASAIVKVYDALNDANKKKFGELGLLKMQSVAFKLI